MTKQEQFLWIVQTTILANGINLTSQPDVAKKYHTEYSASSVLALADEAVRASVLIPDHMSAFRAATQFCTYMLRNLKDTEATACQELKVPSWFARP